MSDGQFSIWIADQIIPLPEEVTPEDQERFDTCQYRSQEKELRTTHGCCNSIKEEGWVCNKLELFKITPNTCGSCPSYLSKNAT